VATVAVLVNPAREEARSLIADAVPWLEERGHRARVLELSAADRAAGQVPAGALDGADLTGADLAVSVGGDGTFLRLVPLAYAAGVPVLGVNFGRLGYLLEVEPGRFHDALDSALDGRANIEERTVLTVTVEGELTPADGDDRSLTDERGDRWWVALNEMVAEKAVPGHMVHLSTVIDGEPFLAYKADGVLVATPTGSTAYNLSAGGPVMAARLRAMVLTPVAAHLAFDRSLVLDAEQVVTVEVRGGRPAVLVVDGREAGRLAPGATVTCRVAAEPLRMVSLGDRGFADLLRRTVAPDRGGWA
jgi:NAD+ kinase